MIRSSKVSSLFLFAAFATACGGTGRTAPAKAPEAEPSPAGASSASAPASEEAGETESLDESAGPAPAQAPKAAMPGSSRATEQTAGGADEMEALASDLDRTLRLSAPDCTTAWNLRDRICELADRLCDLAGRSEEPDVAERCTDGKTRCERATRRVRASCAE